MKKSQIHIGHLIEGYIRQNNINASELARKLGMSRQNIYDLYKRDDLGVKEILSISEYLNHDFLKDIVEQYDYINVDRFFCILKEMFKDHIDKNKK